MRITAQIQRWRRFPGGLEVVAGSWWSGGAMEAEGSTVILGSLSVTQSFKVEVPRREILISTGPEEAIEKPIKSGVYHRSQPPPTAGCDTKTRPGEMPRQRLQNLLLPRVVLRVTNEARKWSQIDWRKVQSTLAEEISARPEFSCRCG